MCVYIYTLHNDCSHKQQQNVFKCQAARGYSFASPGDMTLDHTVHLPAQIPKQRPLPKCDGKMKTAIRPVPGRCRACAREERQTKETSAGAQSIKDDSMTTQDGTTAAGVRKSVMGLQQLVAATKPLDLDE
ncbi:hypothetical protein C8034_v010749 [Colletotrichum sidae]|uniref:Uncharacterized protein n=4 Tax=Colletotrichum orbiculare species complex TaxID=2707354 RepID=N4VCT0_COLOR|nr:hypothetical protein Cob_v001827 [Colletotrichum orbiculare MAFF 240422]TDZ32744.1 hypothetical protein C8035_v011775 [Colletotrichum spinosum]TDZ41366.1 hypothetical protein CTRI78_v009710 [Colletotrichum trifolii]TEA10092.1 hypothetical protein C8034_v010749 [Colletotrichum sidae]